MDIDGDLKVNEAEFVSRCLKDKDLCRLLEGTMGEKYFTGKAKEAGADIQ